jgi:hypothetical protein
MAKREVDTDAVGMGRPKLVVTLGRGRTGKSVFLAWLAEAVSGRLLVVDADPPVLSDRFPQAETLPAGMDGEDRRVWVEGQIERMIEIAGTPDQADMLLDVGGNDILLKRLGRELKLAEMLAAAGVDPVAVHMIGPDDADLGYLREVEDRGLFCPAMTILVLNKKLVKDGRSHEAAFAPVLQSEIVGKVLARGGRIVSMPSLACMDEIEAKGVTPRQAMERWRDIKLGLFNLTRVRLWVEDDMPAMRAKVADWLPA